MAYQYILLLNENNAHTEIFPQTNGRVCPGATSADDGNVFLDGFDPFLGGIHAFQRQKAGYYC